ncbi:MAG: hypothetical protein M3O09_17625 [Acidobacteriota bacterium]|nr:hypothetical protein [Acidobacteriota bacterium]
MNRKLTIPTVAIVLLVLAGWHLFVHRTPKGQAALLTLNYENFGKFEAEFSANANQRRIVALLSPT